MANVETVSTKSKFVLVEFSYGNPKVYWRLTNSNEDQITRLGKFLADPHMTAKIPQNSIASFGKAEAKIMITEAIWSFASQITEGRAFPKTDVRIYTRGTGDSADNIRLVFVGRISSAVRNPGGKVGFVQVKVRGPKNDLDQSLGFSGNSTCGWVFGEAKTCTKDIEVLKETGSLTIPDGRLPTVTITGLIAQADRYWRRGKIVYNGLEIRIREWDNDETFYLSRLLPISWIETDPIIVTVYPGCDKEESTCAFWGQLSTFSGIGIKAPSYNPNIENPNQ